MLLALGIAGAGNSGTALAALFAPLLAKAFGWGARRVDDAGELEEALAGCLAYDGPFFLDVRVAQQENCFPMIPAGRGHHELMLSATEWYEEAPAAPA